MLAASIIAIYSYLKTGSLVDCHVLWPIGQLIVNVVRFGMEFRNYFEAQYTMTDRDRSLHNNHFAMFNSVQFAELFLEYEWIDEKDGGILIEMGAPVKYMYLLVKGSASIKVFKNVYDPNDEGTVVAEVQPGMWVGEMAYFTGEHATATVTIDSKETVCIRFNMKNVSGGVGWGGLGCVGHSIGVCCRYFSWIGILHRSRARGGVKPALSLSLTPVSSPPTPHPPPPGTSLCPHARPLDQGPSLCDASQPVLQRPRAQASRRKQGRRRHDKEALDRG